MLRSEFCQSLIARARYSHSVLTIIQELSLPLQLEPHFTLWAGNWLSTRLCVWVVKERGNRWGVVSWGCVESGSASMADAD